LSIPNGFYLVSGLGLVDMGHRLLRICAGHIFAHRGNYYGPTQVNSFALWFEYEEAIIGTDAVVSAVNRLDTELRSRLPEYLAALVVKLNQYEL
jgi:succinate-acetate transporter protein